MKYFLRPSRGRRARPDMCVKLIINYRRSRGRRQSTGLISQRYPVRLRGFATTYNLINTVMENEQIISEWKLVTRRLWLWLRMLFLFVITWDFFLTVVSHTSQRSLVLLGIGSQFSPFIIIPWIIGIVGLSILLLLLIGKHGQENVKFSNAAYIMLGFMVFVYMSLTTLGIINLLPVAVIMSSAVNATWGIVLMYFRNRMLRLERLE